MQVDAGVAREELREAGRYMLAHGLAWGNAGNLSARLWPDRYIITASGTRLGELAEDDFTECRLATAVVPEGGRRPSKERPMHEAIYETRPEINAVLHASPFYSTLIACSAESVPANLFVESMYYLERVARVPYRDPGSPELGAVVRAHAAEANVLLLENHGVLVYDTSVREALMSLQTLEMTCRIWLAARSAGVTMRELDPDVAQHFLVHAGYKPRREWP
ncbi:MAG TPA: class II aldolase/adducin family protein [Herpetosiphonaceae bacterium]|nr:class II aldolase/adducin family protein [Herpetosiphonaceae bacterium]